ncbi:unnamed protein product [Mytilus coruscus]|uniref:Uncharacterized protein n=1 Tax=Mytilus coruscus TaxID=42192 RepID=A0A6J8EQ73_MYTCO|nr:unnamed protein product [Mytilus coruscus]
MSSKEGLERYKQEKLQKRREQRLESYYRNRNLKEKEYALSDEAVRQKTNIERNKERTNETGQRNGGENGNIERENPRQAGDNHGRILAKFELADCERKLQSSEVISSPEEIEEHKTSKALTEDLKTVIDNCKRKRPDDSLKTINVIISSVSGEKISDNKCRKKLARKLGLPVRRVSRGHAIRTRILKSEKSSWTYTNRKTRSD